MSNRRYSQRHAAAAASAYANSTTATAGEPSYSHPKDTSYPEYTSQNPHNIAYSNMHQTSFEMEDHIHTSHSPIQRSSNYIASNYHHQKPYPDTNYDLGRGIPRDHHHQRFGWNHPYISVMNQQQQQISSQLPPGVTSSYYNDHYGMHPGSHSMWQHHNHDQSHYGDSDSIPQNPSINYQQIYNESSNGYFADRSSSKHQRMPLNNQLKSSHSQSVGGYPNYVEMIEEEPAHTIQHPGLHHLHHHHSHLHPHLGHHNPHSSSLQHHLQLQDSGIPSGYENPPSSIHFQKNHHSGIPVDYENYQETLKSEGVSNSTPDKRLSHYETYYQNINRGTAPIDRIGSDESKRQAAASLYSEAINIDAMINPSTVKQIPITPQSKDQYDDDEEEQEESDGEREEGEDEEEEDEEEEEDLQEERANGSNFPFEGGPESQLKNGVASATAAGQQPGQQGALSSSSQACICNCKKTRCLKLYCECFAKLGYCGEGCHCHACKNRPENDDERQLAINEAKQRNPDAFLFKVTNETELQTDEARKQITESLKKGCNCRRTKCLKKYCECFNAGSYCNHLCKCENCENLERSSPVPPSKRQNAAQSIYLGGGSTSVASILPTPSSRDNRNIPGQNNLVQQQLSFQSSSHYISASAQAKLGVMGLSKFPLTLQSYQSQFRSSHAHNSMLGVNKQEIDPVIDEKSPSLHLKQQTQSYQRKLLFDLENDDSENMSSSNNNSAGSNQQRSEKLKLLKKKNQLTNQKRKKIRSNSQMSNSDEDDNYESNSQESGSAGQRLTRGRFKNRSDASGVKKSDEFLLQQQLENMERKLKQIQQVQNILQYQQQLKQEQAKITGGSSATTLALSEQTPSASLVTPGDVISIETEPAEGKSSTSKIPPSQANATLEEKTLELQRQKQELELSLQQEQLLEQGRRRTSTSPNHNNDPLSNSNKDDLDNNGQHQKRKHPKTLNGEKRENGTSVSNSSQGVVTLANGTVIAGAPPHSPSGESIEDEATSFADNQESESKQSENLIARSSQTSRQSRSYFGQTPITESIQWIKQVNSPIGISFQEIAPTAKPSELLYDPSSYHYNFGYAFDNFPRQNHHHQMQFHPTTTVLQK